MTRVYLCGCNVCNHNVVAAIPIISTQGPSEAEIILQTLRCPLVLMLKPVVQSKQNVNLYSALQSHSNPVNKLQRSSD